MEFAIETRNLGKTFMPLPWPLSATGRRLARPVRALHNVSVQIPRGEVFGLLGPNGAGKTTLLKLLATILLPSEGSARVNGVDVIRENGKVRRMIGLATAEERGFYWRLSGRENLEFFSGLWGLSPKTARRRVQTVLERVDLLPSADEIVGRYSTGMRHRLDLARALLPDPSVLLLDEPTRSVDPLAADQIRTLLRQLAHEGGKTVLLVTHDLTEAAATCDQVAILLRGAICAVFPVTRETHTDLVDRYRAALETS